MVDVSPEIKSAAQNLLASSTLFLNGMTATELSQAMSSNYIVVGDLHIAAAKTLTEVYAVIWRLDRLPYKNEAAPWVQEIFLDGTIQEYIWENYRGFVQGDIYKTEPLAESLATAIYNIAERNHDL